jgi:hypothetical protein
MYQKEYAMMTVRTSSGSGKSAWFDYYIILGKDSTRAQHGLPFTATSKP